MCKSTHKVMHLLFFKEQSTLSLKIPIPILEIKERGVIESEIHVCGMCVP